MVQGIPRLVRRAESASETVTFAEIFFDLVFVFLITQATVAVEHHETWLDLAHSLLPVILVWWMFSGFGWLANAVRPDAAAVRLLLFAAMTAFFIMGLELPHAFDPGEIAFGVAYLVAVAIHFVIYVSTPAESSRGAIRHQVPFNAAGGVIILAASFVPEPWTTVLWFAAVILLYLSPLIGRIQGYELRPHHFVERHALLFLIVIGESVVAIGIGAQSPNSVSLALAIGVALGIALVAGVWWVYFDGDEERAFRAFRDASGIRRQNLAFTAFTTAHLVMVIGVIVVSAGIADAIAHLGEPAERWYLGSGVAVFLGGHALYRALLHTGPVLSRIVGAVVAVPVTWIAAQYSGWMSMAVLVVVLGVVAVFDHLRERRLSASAGSPASGLQ